MWTKSANLSKDDILSTREIVQPNLGRGRGAIVETRSTRLLYKGTEGLNPIQGWGRILIVGLKCWQASSDR